MVINFLFCHLYQIHTFNNNLNEEGMITSANFFMIKMLLWEAVAQRCSVEKVFLEISQNSPENTCSRDPFLIKL